MKDSEFRLECMKLALQMTPVDRSYEKVAEISEKVYYFCHTPPIEETQPVIADKPRGPGRPKKYP